MAILKIITAPDPRYGKVGPRLRQKSEPIAAIDDTVRKLAADMWETMLADDSGVGLAAPQVGVPKRLVVVHLPPGLDDPDDPEIRLTLVNPEIQRAGGQQVGPEGCLSFPELYGEVPRYMSVTVRARDLDGHDLKLKTRGYLARVLQHEIDHLDGILFFDRMADLADLYTLDDLHAAQRAARDERERAELAAQEAATARSSAD
jgi:peptide deformylase